MIQSFSTRETAELFRTGRSRPFGAISRVASRKLIQMNQARILGDLAVPPGNRLEALRGNLSGLHSIWINDQWRIIFRWTNEGPDQVAVADDH